MPASTQDFARVHSVLAHACAELKPGFPESKLATIAHLIAGTMGGKARFFHNPEHVIHVGSHGDAISVIAALFHDLVYLQVDMGVGGQVAPLLDAYTEKKGDSLSLRTPLPPEGLIASVLFDIAPGSELSKMRGLNEFLSALAAAYMLYPELGPQVTAQVLCCIELTIPFRPDDKKGRSAAEQLYERLLVADKKMNWELGESGCRRAIRRAVRLANQDVSSFGAAHGAEFLAHTWELVPETNPLLRAPTTASSLVFAHALMQMESFFSNLSPRSVFQQFDDEPSDHDLDALQTLAARNIEEGRHYFRLKIFALAVADALGVTLGKPGELPVMLGELSNLSGSEVPAKSLLPQKSKLFSLEGGMARQVLELLKNPPPAESGPTLKSSPMTAFLLLELGFEQMLQLWPAATSYFKGKLSAQDLLEQIPPPAEKKITLAVQAALKKAERSSGKTKKSKKAS